MNIQSVLCAMALFVGMSPAAFGQITVSGTGEVQATPDAVRVSVTVWSEDGTAEKAHAKTKMKCNKLHQWLDTQKVDHSDVKTVDVGLHAVTDKENKVVAHRSHHVIRVKLKDVHEVGTFLDGVVKNGATEVSGVHFYVTDLDEYLEKARVLAVKQARRKADTLAQTAGCHVGDVVSITEGGRHRDDYGESRFYAWSSTAATRVAPGTQTVQVTVNVVFSVAGKPTPIIASPPNKKLP